MRSLARNGYTADQVRAALHAENRHMSFRYEVLDRTGQLRGPLGTGVTGRVKHTASAQIKRTARFTLLDDGTVNFLSDRIKPFVRVHMPDGGYAEFPLGVFLLSTPPRRIAAGVITREVEAYDLGQILQDDRVVDRYTVAAGANYGAEVKILLDSCGLADQNLTASTRTLPAARDWAPGTTKARIIDDLLGAINYRPLWFDEDGYAVAMPYVSPSQRASEYTYQDDLSSVIFPEAEQELDLFAIPNRWVLTVSEADRPVLTSTYTNSNPNSATSTVSRGRIIVAPPIQADAATQADLDGLAARTAFEASQVYEHVRFDTAIMPMHSHADVYTLTYSAFGLSARYSETSWEFELKADAKMRHEIRRIVTV